MHFGMVGEQGQIHLAEDPGLKRVNPTDGCEKLVLVCQLQQLQPASQVFRMKCSSV